SAGGIFPVQDNTYVWDTVGNLTSRHNQSGNLTANGSTSRKNLRESFCYDGLNRLIKSHVNTLTGGCSLAPSAQDVEYDGLGNITRKAGVGTYSYGSNAGPHAVTSTRSEERRVGKECRCRRGPYLRENKKSVTDSTSRK